MEKISEAEATVLAVLWNEGPLTAMEVVERVPRERQWSANTVRTLLARLAAKKAIAHEADGRRYIYRPLVERDDYVARESRRLVDGLFGGRVTPLVAHLVRRETLSAEERAEIQALLKELGA